VFVIVAASADTITLRARDASTRSIRTLLPYVALMSAQYVFFTLLAQLDKLVINTQLGATSLGIYTAYYAGTVFIIQQLVMLMTNVLYPVLSRSPDMRPFARKVDRVAAPVAVATVVALFGSCAVILALFGSAYPFDRTLAMCFAGWGALQAVNGVYAAMTYAHSARAAGAEIGFQPVRLAVLVVWFAALVGTDRLTLVASVVGLLGVEVLELINLQRIVRRRVLVLAPEHGREDPLVIAV